MILKFRSYKMFDQRLEPEAVPAGELKEIWPGSGWEWVDGVSRVQEVEYLTLPGWNCSEEDRLAVPNSYLNPHEHYANSYFVGINPVNYNTYSREEMRRDEDSYNMCYVYKNNGTVDLLAIGFIAEVYILNDEGKTLDKIENKNW